MVDCTLCRCLEEQHHAAECYQRARAWMNFRPWGFDEFFAATREQMLGAYHSEQARVRLDHINGHG